MICFFSAQKLKASFIVIRLIELVYTDKIESFVLPLCSVVSHQTTIFVSLIHDRLHLGNLSRFHMLAPELQFYSVFRIILSVA